MGWFSREEVSCWVTLQLAISGSGVLPLPYAFASVGAPLGVCCCVAVAALNDATTQWLLLAAAPTRRGEGVARSYSDLAARANFSEGTKVAVEVSTALLLFGSLAACLAAVGENAGRAVHTFQGWEAGATARLVAPGLAGAGAAAVGLRSFDEMTWASTLGVAFLASLLAAVAAAACLTAGDGLGLPLSPETWTQVPQAISTFGYSLYVAPIALSMVDDRPGRLETLGRATHYCFATTVAIYVALGLCGAAWLGRDTPSDITTGFTPETRGGAWAASAAPLLTVVYLGLATAPMLNPLTDSIAALGRFEDSGDSRVRACVLGLLGLAVFLAASLKSLVLFSLSGATGVCVTCYVVPVACHWSISRERDQKYANDLLRSKHVFLRDVLGPGLALFLGVAVSVLSVCLTLGDALHAALPAPSTNAAGGVGPEEG